MRAPAQQGNLAVGDLPHCVRHLPQPEPGTRQRYLLVVPSSDDLRQRIEAAIPGAHVRVEDLTGGGDHFRAEVVSDRFEGLSRIEQHKLIYGVFGDEVGGPIHALSIKTSTP